MTKKKRENYEEHLENLFSTALDLGFSPTEAKALIDLKRTTFTEVQWKKNEEVKEHILIPKLYPLLVVQEGLGKMWTEHDLWHLGIDWRRRIPIIDIGIFTYLGTKMLGEYVVGEERRDKKWIEMRIDGERVASFDAVLAASGDASLYHELEKMQ